MSDKPEVKRCAYDGCTKRIPEHVAEKGGRFCSTQCRGADYRERGKTVPGKITGAGRFNNGDSYVLIRVSSEFYKKLEPMHVGQVIDVLPPE